MKNLSLRVVESFADADDEKRVKYLDWLRETLTRDEELGRRSLLAGLLLAAVFELIVLAPGSELTVGPLKISDSAQLLALFPVFVAYLTLQVFIAYLRYMEGRLTFGQLFEEWNAGAVGKEVYEAVLPPEPLYFGISGGHPNAEDRPDNMARDLSLVMTLALVFLVPIAFYVHAFVALWPNGGSAGPLLWISMALTLGLATLTMWFAVVAARR